MSDIQQQEEQTQQTQETGRDIKYYRLHLSFKALTRENDAYVVPTNHNVVVEVNVPAGRSPNSKYWRLHDYAFFAAEMQKVQKYVNYYFEQLQEKGSNVVHGSVDSPEVVATQINVLRAAFQENDNIAPSDSEVMAELSRNDDMLMYHVKFKGVAEECSKEDFDKKQESLRFSHRIG